MTFVSASRFFSVTYDGVPILDVQHQALKSDSALRAGPAWRDAMAAHTILGIDYDTFIELPRDQRITVLAQYEIKWRVDALLDWESSQKAKRGR